MPGGSISSNRRRFFIIDQARGQKTINRFLGTNRIYHKPTGSYGARVLLLVVGGLLVLTLGLLPFLWPAGDPGLLVLVVWPLGALAGLVLIGWGLVRGAAINRIVKSRRYLGKIDPQNKQPAGSRVGESILLEEARADTKGQWSAASFKARVLESGGGWWVYDATSVVHNDKGVPVAERCYTVFEAKLRQITPHLVFDGKDAKGRQFKSIYSNSQLLTGVLGAELDRKFAVYSPKYHAIDTLSFITPEVIEALLDLDDCDLEFVDNSLLCYAPLLSADRLRDFRRRWFNLHAKVNDNLRLYQPKEAAVGPFGRRLLKSYSRGLAAGVFLVGLAGFFLALAWADSDSDSQNAAQLAVGAAVIGLAGVVALVTGFVGRRRNRRAEREFLRGRA